MSCLCLDPSWWHVQAEITPDGVQTACRTTRQGRMTQLMLPALPVLVTGTAQYPETQRQRQATSPGKPVWPGSGSTPLRCLSTGSLQLPLKLLVLRSKVGHRLCPEPLLVPCWSLRVGRYLQTALQSHNGRSERFQL